MTSERTVLFVIIGLALCGVIASICACVLLWHGKDGNGMIMLASTAVGALAAVLASTHSTSSDSKTVRTETVETPAPEEKNANS